MSTRTSSKRGRPYQSVMDQLNSTPEDLVTSDSEEYEKTAGKRYKAAVDTTEDTVPATPSEDEDEDEDELFENVDPEQDDTAGAEPASVTEVDDEVEEPARVPFVLPQAKHEPAVQAEDVQRYAEPSELDVAYGLHNHELHFSRIDPTSARLVIINKKKDSENSEAKDAAASAASSKDGGDKKKKKVPLPNIVFGDEKAPIFTFLCQQGRCEWDVDLIKGNYDPAPAPGDAKFKTSALDKIRIAVPLMFETDSPFVQWLKQVSDTVLHKIIEERDPSMRHITDPLYQAAESTTTSNLAEFNPTAEQLQDKIMKDYVKRCRVEFMGAYHEKDDKKFGYGASISGVTMGSGTLTEDAKKYIKKQYGDPPVWPHEFMKTCYQNNATYVAGDLKVFQNFPVAQPAAPPAAMEIKLHTDTDTLRRIRGGTNVALQIQMRIVPNPEARKLCFSYRLKAVHKCGKEDNGGNGGTRLGGQYSDPSGGFEVVPFDPKLLAEMC